MRDPLLRSGDDKPKRSSRAWLVRGLALLIALVVVAAGVCVRYAGVLAAVAPGCEARNGEMEGLYLKGIAFGWDNNSYGDAQVSFSEEEAQPHSGNSAQHIHLERVTNGAAQIRQLGIAVRAGQPYTLTVWLRGTVEGPVFVGVRQHEAPYQRYVAQSVRVTPEWRRYVISGTPEADGPSAGIFFSFNTAGDLWIDDVELREGAPEQASIASAAPERKGNLLYNSSFELGADGWGPVARLKIDETGAAQGHACARCTTNWEPILLESRPVVIRPGQRHTVSAALKAAGPAEVELVMMESADDGGDRPGQRDAIRQSFKIGPRWRRVSLSGVLRAPFMNGYLLQLNLKSGSGPVWVDAVQWEEGGMTAYRPAAPVEAAVSAPARFLRPNQPAITDCRIYRAPSAAASTDVKCALEDAEGRQIAQQTVSSDPQQGSAVQSARLTWKLPRPGIYRVVATPDGTPVERTGQAILCLFPTGPRAAAAQRIGIHGWSNPASPNSALQAASYLGAGGYRLHDFRSFVQWYEVEPTAGEFVWFDRDVDDLAQRGYRMMATLCRPPLWAGREGNQRVGHGKWTSAPPRDWGEWDRYVEAVAWHYRGKIGAWEVWNEPYARNFWTGTPAEYVELLARTRRVIKAADPSAQVIGGIFSPDHAKFTQAVFRGGGLESMDVVSYHDYLEPAKVAEPADGGAPPFYEHAVALRDQIRRLGGTQPLWCTETGARCPSFYSWLPKQGQPYSSRVSVGMLVKGLTLQLAAGVEHTYYYHMGGVEWGQGYPSRMLNAAYTLLDYDGSPKPTLPALAQVIAMLGDASEPAELSTPALRAYLFHREAASQEGQYVAVVWARGAGTARLARPGTPSVRAVDAMGAPLAWPVSVDDRPVYLLGESRQALVEALGASPLASRKEP